MTILEISSYFQKQCRFRLKDGKEVYGVIWEDTDGSNTRHYFASVNEHRLYQEAKSENDQITLAQLKRIAVNLNDIIMVERIAC